MRRVEKRRDAPRPAPLTEPVFLILMSLANKPRHGYALIQDIETLSNGRVRLSTGTLYGAFHRLLEQMWIERFDQPDTSREKQAYKLTPIRRQQVHIELE
jgi:DNA-binding PadR family transcriptional regulator